MKLTEQQFDEIYDDVLAELKKLLSGREKTEDELKEIMKEIKKIYTTEDDAVPSNQITKNYSLKNN